MCVQNKLNKTFLVFGVKIWEYLCFFVHFVSLGENLVFLLRVVIWYPKTNSEHLNFKGTKKMYKRSGNATRLKDHCRVVKSEVHTGEVGVENEELGLHLSSGWILLV